MVGNIIIGCGGVYLLVGIVTIVAFCRAAGKETPTPEGEGE